MFWEFVATLFAGLGTAGVVLFARGLSRRLARLGSTSRWIVPKWAIPVGAGLGMLAFQIYSEYSWFEHQRGLLPETVQVVRTVEQTAVWRPWSYLVPQTVRFMALDVAGAAPHPQRPHLILADLYLFERRMSARRIPQVIHCRAPARADFSQDLPLPKPGERLSEHWHALPLEHPLVTALCPRE